MVVRLVSATSESGATSSFNDQDTVRWTCSFVNNMPDGAFKATEHQFLDLLAIGSGEDVIEVRRHTMDGISRESAIIQYIDECYVPPSDIRESPPDILIVTGSNPIELQIEAEPYWAEMSDLLQWGSMNVSSMMLSCLAAHAALLVFDGIARVRLDEKCTGVFHQSVDVAHPLGARINHDVVLPHSRTNTAHVNLLRESGYQIAIESLEVGWGVATKTIDECDVVLIQAHPEYEPSSLLREYRRDARRYVTRGRTEMPVLPYHCVGDEDWAQLQSLQVALSPSPQGVILVDDYPFEEVGARAPWPWRDMAQQLYANWLSGVKVGKGDTRAR